MEFSSAIIQRALVLGLSASRRTSTSSPSYKNAPMFTALADCMAVQNKRIALRLARAQVRFFAVANSAGAFKFFVLKKLPYGLCEFVFVLFFFFFFFWKKKSCPVYLVMHLYLSVTKQRSLVTAGQKCMTIVILFKKSITRL